MSRFPLFYFCCVLKVGGQDSGETGTLREDVRDSIAGMVQIMQSYRSKSMFSRVFVSDLFRKRQEEAEESINACVQRLQVYKQEQRQLYCLRCSRLSNMAIHPKKKT